MVGTAETVELLLARQPILDRDGATVGYELLHRPADGRWAEVDGATATASVLVDGLFGHGIEALTAGLPAWVNVTEALVLDGTLDPVLRSAPLVVELLEEVPDTAPLRTAVRGLRARGVRVALDDVVAEDPRLGLVALVDVVKIDVQATSASERRALTRLARRHGTRVLFEKVEDADQAAEAAATGADLLQGYHFARPLPTTRRDIRLEQSSRIQLLALVNQPQLDLAAVEQLVRQDVYLAQRFVAFVNSASFGWRRRIDSIHHALVLVGDEPLRRWLSLVVLATVTTGRAEELLVLAATRARFLEELAPAWGLSDRALDLFALGILSVLDLVLDVSLATTLGAMGLPEDVRDALGGRPGTMGTALELARTLETADWVAAESHLAQLELDRSMVAAAHAAALEWSMRVRSASRA